MLLHIITTILLMTSTLLSESPALGLNNITQKDVLPISTDFLASLLTTYGLNETYMTQEQFKDLMQTLSIGSPSSPSSNAHEETRKRRAINNFEDLEKCFSPKTLLKIFQIPEGSLIDAEMLKSMSPALIQQMNSKSCVLEVINNKDKNLENWQPWIATTVALTIISFGSLIGAVAAPFAKKPWFSFVIMFLVALAVAVLVADAILHLFPHSMGLHNHGDVFSNSKGFLWKSMMFLAGIFVFFTFEITMHAFGGGHTHDHQPQTSIELQEEKNGTVVENGNVHYSKSSETVTYSNNNDTTESKLQISDKFLSAKSFKSVVWMILVGDAIHNFMDGVAVGVAFSESWPGGLHGGVMTSIAIFCHELPHELGDFAVLVASGLSIKQAMMMNYFSSLTAILGGFLGVSLGTNWDATPWIFAATSGLFVYIALADMLPEALHNSYLKKYPFRSILMLDIGMLLGFAIMFCLAAWEDDMKKALQ